MEIGCFPNSNHQQFDDFALFDNTDHFFQDLGNPFKPQLTAAGEVDRFVPPSPGHLIMPLKEDGDWFAGSGFTFGEGQQISYGPARDEVEVEFEPPVRSNKQARTSLSPSASMGYEVSGMSESSQKQQLIMPLKEDGDWFAGSGFTFGEGQQSYGPVEVEVEFDPPVRSNKRARAPPSPSVSTGQEVSGMSESSQQQQQQQRRLWVKDRSKDWWERCDHPDFPDEEFRRCFRMSRATFDLICQELEHAVTKKNTSLRDAIPVRQRVAVCIWRLATGEPLRLVSKRFGLGISTCHKLVLEVCSAIKNVLMPKFLTWPDEAAMRSIKDEFKARSGIPNVGGSMYTTHVPIIAPKENSATYLNRRHTERNGKTCYTVTVQGVVDARGVFTDICIGWPGSMPDDVVLEKSALYRRASQGLLRDVWVVGHSGHPLTDWVLVPYTHSNLTWAQHAFNEKIREVGSASRAAFARLKGRWSCLQKRTEIKLQDLPVVLGACCVLHNICEMRSEGMAPELSYELFDDEMVPERNGVRSMSAARARDHIAHNLLHHGRQGTSNSFP